MFKKTMKPDEKDFHYQWKKLAKRMIQNIKRIDKKIETNVREFIDWLEEEKNKVY
jgi:BMFP domain-containing protein YqiC